MIINDKSSISEDDIYFTVTTLDIFHGIKPFRVGSIVKLVKDFGNKFDSEAIRVDLRYAGPSGYVANSVRTVALGTMSSGRLYDKILDEDFGIVRFILGSVVICKLLTHDEIEVLRSNPECDINYL